MSVSCRLVGEVVIWMMLPFSAATIHWKAEGHAASKESINGSGLGLPLRESVALMACEAHANHHASVSLDSVESLSCSSMAE